MTSPSTIEMIETKGSRIAEWLARLPLDQKVQDSIPGSNPMCRCHSGGINSHIQALLLNMGFTSVYHIERAGQEHGDGETYNLDTEYH